uniref:Metalloendopeptidase n=1 Tax=Strongyloides venezuelensis TaxID=75913 RepID=A0A0K0FSA5_STRVS
MYLYNDSNTIYKRDIREYYPQMWKFPIKYKIGNYLNNYIIKKALEEIESNTCVKFQEDNLLNINTEGIFFELSTRCMSYVGLEKSNERQTIELSYVCSSGTGYVLHEVGHALGLLHEHTRTDRDKFVNIDFSNIKKGLEINFKIPNGTWYKNYSTHYDYGSVMSYRPNEVSISNWKQVTTSKLHPEYDRMTG